MSRKRWWSRSVSALISRVRVSNVDVELSWKWKYFPLDSRISNLDNRKKNFDEPERNVMSFSLMNDRVLLKRKRRYTERNYSTSVKSCTKKLNDVNDIHSFILLSSRLTCARRNITIVVRQEPQTKSTMLMNEWKRNTRRRRRRKEENGCWRWCSTYAHRTTTREREFFFFVSSFFSQSKISIRRIKKKRKECQTASDFIFSKFFPSSSHSKFNEEREREEERFSSK